jgi:hypothetical protein
MARINTTDRLYENVRTIRDAGWLIGLPSWADVDVVVDGERVLHDCRTDYRGHLFLSQDWFDEHASGKIDVYVQQTKDERERRAR